MLGAVGELLRIRGHERRLLAHVLPELVARHYTVAVCIRFLARRGFDDGGSEEAVVDVAAFKNLLDHPGLEIIRINRDSRRRLFGSRRGQNVSAESGEVQNLYKK
jgi:hypothetical protein